MKKNSLLIFNLVFLAANIFVVLSHDYNHAPEVKASRDYSNEYKFTNPILDYENVSMKETAFFSNEIRSEVDDLKDKYNIAFESIYFRDLDNGQWIGINEKEQFASASLIKIPVIIALFRQEEAVPGTLNKVVQVTEADIQNMIVQDIKPGLQVAVGESYTLLELAERMIQESDNVAMKALVRNLDDRYRSGVFESVGVAFNLDKGDVMVRVKDYAGFFRVLFNASYLSRSNSERVLEILSKTIYDKALVAGVPKGVLVSHKFGERSSYVNDILSSVQLHDCGIVYYPQKPYILCVMTRGTDYDDQAAFIREVSSLFYRELEKQL